MQQAEEPEEYDFLYKVVLVGDAGVGKTHILSRFIRGTLPRSVQATIGVEFATRTLSLQSGGTVKAQFWDTAGQERYRSITRAHYRRAVGAFLVYDIANTVSFEHIRHWVEDLREHAEPDIVIMLVGNKTDLDQRQVQRATAEAYAKGLGLLFAEVSAVATTGIQDAFQRLLEGE